MRNETESEFVQHVPCGKCGSSDANSLYTDGHQFCFACRAYTAPDGEVKETATPKMNANLIDDLTFVDLTKRGLTEESCRHWGYGIGEFSGHPVQVANYRTPDGSRVVAQKVRFPNKDFIMLGEAKDAGLYGQHLWRESGKYLVITEGEIDAISVSQIDGHKWPVVSIPTGAAGAKKALAKQLEWAEKFENVILMFDNDEPGQAAARECAELFAPGKCRISSLPLKDANDMLKAGRGAEIVAAKFAAKVFRPDGIVNGTELWDRIITANDEPGVPYPFRKLQDLTLGRRTAEIVMVGAGTGVGKSEWCRLVAHDGLTNHGETLGYVALEESVERTCLGLMGLTLGRRIHISKGDIPEGDLRFAFERTVGGGKCYLYDHWGSTESDNLLNKIRYLVRGCGCTTIVLDHISIVVSGIGDGDERRLIDNTMTRLRSLVQELKCRMIVVAHLKAVEGTPHEEGGRVTLGQFRGSKSLTQLSDIVIGLERNQQDETLKNFTTIRVLKNRYTGETGEADCLKYDQTTGRMLEACVFDATPAPAAPANTDF